MITALKYLLVLTMLSIVIAAQVITSTQVYIVTRSLLDNVEMFALMVATASVWGLIWYLFVEHILLPTVNKLSIL